jgi:hypothetical protein
VCGSQWSIGPAASPAWRHWGRYLFLFRRATLRDHLRRAGVDRAALFEDTPTVKQITFYDLRATGITWRTLRGDDARTIKHAAGHEKYATTEGYVREAAIYRGRVGEPFPILPELRYRFVTPGGVSVGNHCVPKGIRTRDQSTPDDAEAGNQGSTCTLKSTDEHEGPPKSEGVGQNLAQVDSVEKALARALELASEAGEWSVVSELARQLEGRRRARVSPAVADLDAERAKREGKG